MSQLRKGISLVGMGAVLPGQGGLAVVNLNTVLTRVDVRVGIVYRSEFVREVFMVPMEMARLIEFLLSGYTVVRAFTWHQVIDAVLKQSNIDYGWYGKNQLG